MSTKTDASKRCLIDAVPALDLPTLVRALANTGRLLGCFTLAWHHGDHVVRVDLDVDLRPAFDSGIRVYSDPTGKAPKGAQTARIVSGNRGRLRFVCPLTTKLVDTLFVSNGVLGSREGLRLRYPSQTAEKRLARARGATFAPNPAGEARYRALLELYDMPSHDHPPLDAAEKIALENQIAVRTALLRRALEGNVAAIWKYLKLMGEARARPAVHRFLDVYESAAFRNLLIAARASQRSPSVCGDAPSIR